MSGRRGFFGSLFDFSFTSFVFPKLISFLYAVFVILFTLAAIGVVVYALVSGSDFEKSSSVPGWTMLIVVPIAYILYLIIIRIWFEIAIVLFRIYENTGRIADGTGGGA